MSDQVVSLRTIYGWFSVLAAMTRFGATDDGPAQLMAGASVPVAVVDLQSRSVLAMSDRFRTLLGGPAEVDLHVLVDDPELLGPLIDLLLGGAIDAYEVCRELALGNGERLSAYSWLAVCDHKARRHALWILRPVDGQDGNYQAEGAPAQWPERVSGLVVGTFDAEWCTRRVSLDIEAVLGYPVSEAVGTSFIGLVHPEDVPLFLETAAHCLAERAAVGVELRLAHRSGAWRPAHMMIAPLAPGYLDFGFVIAVQNTDQADPLFRVADLERALWRIAQEVQGSGVAATFARVPDPAALPGLDDLSGRQWEVLTRLLAGERAPAIARAMHLSQSTVRNHLSGVFTKLHVHSQAELLELVRHTGSPAGPGR